MERSSIFASHDAFEDRLITDWDVLARKVEALKELGLKIVLTSGSYDLMHIGHMRYLREARKCGDVLIVGVDSDAKVRSRKGRDGEMRPVIPENERAEMISHSRYADIITLKPSNEAKWALIKLVRPDVLVVSERNGDDAAAREELKEWCGEVKALAAQAKTSTSANIRKLQLEKLIPSLSQIKLLIDKLIDSARGEIQ